MKKYKNDEKYSAFWEYLVRGTEQIGNLTSQVMNSKNIIDQILCEFESRIFVT